MAEPTRKATPEDLAKLKQESEREAMEQMRQPARRGGFSDIIKAGQEPTK
jgi:hypothetical protein